MISELRTIRLFTPDRLFAGLATSGLSRHAVFLERAKTHADCDQSASRFALAAYLVVRLIDAYLSTSRVTSLEGQDGFLWQLNAVRRHITELPVEATEVGHLAGIVEAVPVNQEPANTLRISLAAYAYYLEHEGRLAEALEVLELTARIQKGGIAPGDYAAWALFAGRLNRQLARWEEAVACYEASEEAAVLIGDHVTVFRSRLGRAIVYRGQGNIPKALAVTEQVARDADVMQLVDVQAMAYADLSAIYAIQGLQLEALQAGYKAFLLTSDPVQRMRSLGDLAIDLGQIGAYDAARLAFEIVVKSKTNFRLCTNAVIELMDLESTLRNRVAFERHRVAAEASRERMSPDIVTDFLYKLGIGYARFGQLNRAKEALQSALKLAEMHKFNAWYFKVERALSELENDMRRIDEVPLPRTEISKAPVVLEMESGLREYSVLQTV